MSRDLYALLKDYTMIDPVVFDDNLALAKGLPDDVRGCVVECGVWKGGMIAAIAATLGPQRAYWLFDSFQGLPPAQRVDGPAALAWQANTASPRYFDNCAAPATFAQQAMDLAGVACYNVVPGWFKTTLPVARFNNEPIALLRLDCDWYDPVLFCLDTLFNRVAPGGLIVIDDYYAWDGCARAIHDFLSVRQATERIRSLGDVCYLVKQ